ncbi:MAG: hypothetical protein Q4D99_03970 [Bacillota bacterium]|nr:hypothetical protein [Bacillota bacterium]
MEKKLNSSIKDNTEKAEIICMKCDTNMEEMETTFSYLGRTFKHKILRCPSCGQVYVPEELAKGRMAQVESMMEEK